MIGITVAGIIFREKKIIRKSVGLPFVFSTNEYRATNSTEKWIE
jgi:hypothetical protein